MKFSASDLAQMLDSRIDSLHIEAAISFADGDLDGALGFLVLRGVISDNEMWAIIDEVTQ